MASLASLSEMMQTLLSQFEVMQSEMRTLRDRDNETRPATTSASASVAAAPEPLDIPRPTGTSQANRYMATCKPPREPALTGDKQYEWQEFEREFLRYFRITQGYFMEPEVQVDLLLATAGDKVRKVFYQLALPAEDAKSLEKVIMAIRQAFSQQQSTIVNKYLFMKIRREPGEELDTFVTRLRETAKRCTFVDEDQRVLEQLIFSTIDNVEILKRMVKDSPPTLNEVIRILKADEVASLELNRMVGSSASVNAVSQNYNSRHTRTNGNKPRAAAPKSGGTCSNCIFSHGSNDQCPAKEMECFFCKKRGHMIAKCRKRLAGSSSSTQKPVNQQRVIRQPERRNVHEVEQLEDVDTSDAESVAVDSVFIGSLNTNKDCWQTAIRIGNKLVNCKVDTGAEVNVMPQRVYKQLRDKPSLTSTKTVLRTVAGQLKPLGVINTTIQFKEKTAVAKFFVVDDSTPTLCGLQTSVELGLVKKLFP